MKIKLSHLGFTLVELVVGITISMLLMVSVGVFISGGMQNVFLQQKVFENAGDFISFNTTLHSHLNILQEQAVSIITPNSLLFKSGKYFGNGGFTYIGTGASISGFYCSGSEVPAGDITQHVFIKDFIPFFENSDNNTDLEDIFSASAGVYTSYVKQHVVKDGGGSIIVGKNTFGDTLGATGLETYLNAPTGLALDTINDILYISDTLNNRVLAYNTTDFSIKILLDETDGLDEPTGLYFESNTLLIANSAAGEILEHASRDLSNFPSTTLDVNENNIERFNIEVYRDGVLEDIGLDVNSFTNFTSPNDFFEINSSAGEYIFTDYGGAESAWALCSIGNTRYNSGNPQKCTALDIGRAGLFDQNITNIDIENVPGNPSNGNYYIRLELFDSSNNSISEQYFPYFTQGDDNLLTQDDNTLVVLDDTTYEYPNGIWGTNIMTDVADFESSFISGLTWSFSGTYDSVLETPIDSFGVEINSDLLTMTGSYYKSYDCFNPDNRITREFIWKKNLK